VNLARDLIFAILIIVLLGTLAGKVGASPFVSPFMSPPIPPVPPLCGPGVTGQCVEWQDSFSNWRPDSPLATPEPMKCHGKRYGEQECE
jgi:hypothetical protein